LVALKAEGISASAPGYIRKSDLPDLYSALDVYLLTSRVEGGPCTVFEAMACETAVVSTRVGAVPQLIVDGVNGFSADVDDEDSLVSAIVALGIASKKRIEIGKKARETVSKVSWGTVLSPLEDVYDQLIKSRGRTDSVLETPPWMSDSRALLRCARAADALANVVPRVRSRSISVFKGISLLREMLQKQSLFDIAKGARMLWGRNPG
jgi:hypothetical protein